MFYHTYAFILCLGYSGVSFLLVCKMLYNIFYGLPSHPEIGPGGMARTGRLQGLPCLIIKWIQLKY